MCGITGLFHSGAPFEAPVTTISGPGGNVLGKEIKAMTMALKHRGPDSMDIWTSGPVAMGSTRLSILDLSDAGRQPMSKNKRYWIVYNGEVYNYIELRSELASRYEFRTGTDTEVILAAYEMWGEKCIERFNGMFAFIIWDAKNGVAFGARDRLGVKPFYYSEDSGGGSHRLCQ